jgi:hypothetical protein
MECSSIGYLAMRPSIDSDWCVATPKTNAISKISELVRRWERHFQNCSATSRSQRTTDPFNTMVATDSPPPQAVAAGSY